MNLARFYNDWSARAHEHWPIQELAWLQCSYPPLDELKRLSREHDAILAGPVGRFYALDFKIGGHNHG